MKNVWSLVREGLRLFTRRGRIILALYGASLILLSALDAAALFLLARVFNLGAVTDSTQIVVDTRASTLLLILFLFCLRSVLSTVMTFVALRQGAKEETLIGDRALKALINPRTQLSTDGLGDFHNSVDRGPKELVLIVFHAVTVPCEALTAAAIFGALVIFQPLTAVVAVIYFAVVGAIQQVLLSRRASRIGDLLVIQTNRVYQLLADIRGLRRILSAPSSEEVVMVTHTSRSNLAIARADQIFVATLPRYFLEVVLALGLLIVGGTTYFVSGPPAALAATSLFVAAGFRLLPIVNRLQALILAILAYVPTARLALSKFVTNSLPIYPAPRDPDNIIELKNVCFSYLTSTSRGEPAEYILKSVSLQLRQGGQYAIVGPSGAGKSTLVDLLLGLNVAQSGEVYIAENVRAAYVPQDTYIAEIPLRNNVALRWSDGEIDRGRVRRALKDARLDDLVLLVDDDTPLKASELSGGQKQRIGLARALYASANLLVLDEATSALDLQTEQIVNSAIDALRGFVTVVHIGHRLSSVYRADRLFYLDEGSIIASGSFEELIETVPNFRHTVELWGFRDTPR